MDRMETYLFGFLLSFALIFTGLIIIINKNFAKAININSFEISIIVSLVSIFSGIILLNYIQYLLFIDSNKVNK